MENKDINHSDAKPTSPLSLSPEAVAAIEGLQHPNGTFGYYRDALSRLSVCILHMSDEIGMSDTEALHHLRVIDAVMGDLLAIAGPGARAVREDFPEDVARKIEGMFPGARFFDVEDFPDDET